MKNTNEATKDLGVGDKVWVHDNLGHLATITVAGPMWLTVKADDSLLTWRMRRDNQTTEIRPESWNVRFLTLEQKAYRDKLKTAHEFLRTQGIIIVGNSPWKGREIELAATLKVGMDYYAQMERDDKDAP